MSNYLNDVLNPETTPQTEPLPGEKMVKNNAGGYVFEVSDMQQVERWLILGSFGGSYYVGQKELTLENVETLQRALKANGPAVVDLIVNISKAGRAPKNDPALFALAMAASPKFADAPTNARALAVLSDVARTGTHLFQFLNFVRKNKLRGMGRGLRTALGNWYLEKDTNQISYQAIKYQNRDGVSHRDILRLTHIKKAAHQPLFQWIVKGQWQSGMIPQIVEGYESAKKETDEKALVKLIETYGLTREMLPTEALNFKAVWEALLQKMPLTAMIRNLGKMTSIGLIAQNSEAAKLVRSKLGDAAYLRKSRIHPVAVLLALKTYEQGHGIKGSLKWDVVRSIVDSLDDAYYAAFGNVQNTDKRFYLGLDISSSMGMGTVAGLTNFTPREAAACMAMVAIRTEDNWMLRGFSTSLIDIPISKSTSLADAVRITSGLPFGGTDCALPIKDAIARKIPVDVFCTYSDAESWAGGTHATVELDKYRQKMGIPAKLVTIDFVANRWTLGKLNDPGTLAVTGFDASVPQLISSFVGGAEEPSIEVED